MFNWKTNKEKKKAESFDGWGSAPINSWQEPTLPNSKWDSNAVEDNRSKKMNQVHPISLLSVGKNASDAALECLKQFTGDGQYDLSTVSLLSILPEKFEFLPVGRKFFYRNISIDNPSSGFEYLQVLSNRKEIVVIVELGIKREIEICEEYIKQLKQWFETVNLFLLTPSNSTNSEALAEIREIERFGWSLPHVLRINQDQIIPLKNTGQTVDHIFYTSSSFYMMAEILYAWIHPISRHTLDQEINNINFQITRQEGHPHLVTINAASLYLPKAEHQAFLTAMLIKFVLFGNDRETGFLNESQQNWYEEFRKFRDNKYYHPLFGWMIEQLAERRQAECPVIGDIEKDNFYTAFCNHLILFVNNKFQSREMNLLGLETLLSLLEQRIRKARSNIDEKQKELQPLLINILKFIGAVKTEVTNWSKVVYQPNQNGIQSFTSSQSLPSLEYQINRRYQESIQCLRTLLQRQFSIPALDGTLAEDPELYATITQRIKDDHLFECILLTVDINREKQIALRLCLASDGHWRSYSSSEIMSNDFYSSLDQIVSGSVVAMQSHYTENTFLSGARKKASELSIIENSSLPHLQDAKVQLGFVFTNDLNLAKEFSSYAFPNITNRIIESSNYPPTRICSIKIDALIPFKSTEIYKNSVNRYKGISNIHISVEERLATEIEKKIHLFTDGEYRMLSPEICATFTDPGVVECFFRCLMAGLFIWESSQGQLGSNITHTWVLKEIGNRPKQSFGQGDDQESLKALIKTYIDFVIIRRYYTTRTEEKHSPFHKDKWKTYIKELLCDANSKLEKYRILERNRILLWRNFGFINSKQKDGLFDIFNPVMKLLADNNRWIERDFIGLLLYYYDQISSELHITKN